MKGKLTALLALCVLLLTACAVREPPPQLRPLVPGEGEARYSAHSAEGAEKAFPSGDSYLYAVPKLGVENFAALGAEEQKKAVGNTTAFNEKMERVLEDAVARGEALVRRGEEPAAGPAWYDRMTGGTCVLKSLVSVVMDSETYAGGAHPSSAAWSYLFDLDSGEFISPTQFAQDPEGFRRAVADILEEQVEDMDREERAALWPDYQDTLARWDRAAVQFHPDWLTVRFAPYELGPFALGELAFTVPYDRVTGPLGESGLRKLGISLA